MSANEVEIYPMPSFVTLDVQDIEASARWYCEALGFTHVFTFTGPDNIPALVHLRWTRYGDLLLFPDREGSRSAKGPGVGLNYSVDDVDQLAERARQHQVQILEGPVNRPWNIRELVIQDQDGSRLVFNSRVQGDGLRSVDEFVDRASKGF